MIKCRLIPLNVNSFFEFKHRWPKLTSRGKANDYSMKASRFA